MIAEFKFGEWLPDQIDYKNPGLETCRNAIPSPAGYEPVLSFVNEPVTYSGTIAGAHGFERKDTTRIICFATLDDLFVIVNNQKTASGLTLSLTTNDRVSFVQFGHSIYATAKHGGTWVLDDVNIDTQFTPLTVSVPQGGAMGRIKDFLIMGNLTDLDVSDAPYRLRWSQFNNPSGTWASDIATQAGAVDLGSDLGEITAITSGDTVIVFQKYGMSRLTYTGGASVFTRDTFETNRGCKAPESVLRHGEQVYFLSHDGFFMTDGRQAINISRGRVWDWFIANSNGWLHHRVQGAIDWQKRCLLWAFADTYSDQPTRQICYNWETRAWSFIERGVTWIVASTTPAQTLEQVAATYPNLDTMDVSLDSPLFEAQDRALYAFHDGRLKRAGGHPLPATFETGDFQPDTGRRSFVRSVTPLVSNDNQSTIVQVGGRDVMTSGVHYGARTTIGTLGFAPVSSDHRYHRVLVRMPARAVWKDAYGLQVDYTPSGVL